MNALNTKQLLAADLINQSQEHDEAGLRALKPDIFDIHDATDAILSFQLVCDPDVLKSHKAPKNSDQAEVRVLGETGLAMSNRPNISHNEAYLNWIFEVICRLHEAEKSVRLLCGHSEDKQFIYRRIKKNCHLHPRMNVNKF